MKYETDIPTQAGELQAYFDGELDDAGAERVARTIERDPQLRHHVEQMAVMRDLVGRSLEMRATEVPRARFEQIWDEIDRSIGTETRAADAPASFWQRIWSALGPVRISALAAVGAAAVAVVAMQMGESGPVNEEPSVASVPRTAEPTPHNVQPAPNPAPTPPAIAESFPSPRAADAEIHGIEFGGKQGRISHTGVVTVLYVEEDASSQKSERSL